MANIIIRCLGIVVISTMSIVISAGTSQSNAGSSPSPEVMKLLEEGSAYYLRHQLSEAIGPYAKALALEKKQATLGATLTRVLIDNLGTAYGITGDLDNAKATFEYGLSQDDTYPMFYYNLACTHAEMNDIEGTLANLKLAFKYKDNTMADEQFPDPAEDDSFQRFLNDERFIKLLREPRTAY